MNSGKEESQKGGFLGNLTKRIGKKQQNKNGTESKHSVILYGTIMSIPCRNIMVLAKWIGLDLQLKQVDAFNKREHKSEDYLKMNPAGTMPTLDDNGFYIWESRAILIYLLGKYGKGHSDLYPADHQKRGFTDNILFYDSSSLFPSIGEYFYPRIFSGQPPNSEKEMVMRDRLSVLNMILKNNHYVAGNQISIADLSVVGGLSLLEVCDYNLSSFPNIEQWMNKVKKEIPHYNETTSPGVEAVTKVFKSHNN